MNKDQLKQLVRQIVKEAIGLGVAETNIQESAPPNFPAALEKKLEHDETDMNNPEEKREVELAIKAKAAAEEILKMHGK